MAGRATVRGFLAFLWRRQRVAMIAAVLALAAFGFFAGNFALRALYFHDPRHQQQALEPWMTPRYVSRSWQIPPKALDRILELERPHVDRNGPPTMAEVAASLGLTLPEVQALLEAEVAARREDRGGGGRPARDDRGGPDQ